MSEREGKNASGSPEKKSIKERSFALISGTPFLSRVFCPSGFPIRKPEGNGQKTTYNF